MHNLPLIMRVQSIVISQNKGKSLQFRILLPPNIDTTASRNAITIKIEALYNQNWCLPEKLDRGLAYQLPESHYNLAALIESWCEGKLYGFLKLTRIQLKTLLATIADEPIVFMIDNLEKPLEWDDGCLVGIHEHLVDYPSEKCPPHFTNNSVHGVSTPTTKSSSYSSKKSASHDLENDHSSSPEANAALENVSKVFNPDTSFSGATVIIDGSTQFLAVTLPSKEHPYYREILDLLKRNRFILEPSNRKWWIRDKWKTLHFLAQYWEIFKSRYQATFTENFVEKTQHVRFAKIQCNAEEWDQIYKISIKLSDSHLDEASLRAAVIKGQSYLECGNDIILINPEELDEFAKLQRRLSRELKKPCSTEFTYHVPVSNLVQVETWIEDLSIHFEKPATWKARSEALRNLSKLKEAPLDRTLKNQLRLYQQIGVAWMWHLYNNQLGGILADEMGLGKTIQALGLIDAINSTYEEQGRDSDLSLMNHLKPAQGQTLRPICLVICPASLTENWKREAERFVPHIKVSVHHGSSRTSRQEILIRTPIIITTYNTLAKDYDLFETIDFTAIIADEAQHIKNRKTQNAKVLKSLKGSGRFLLTGTPIENSIDDLYSLFEFLMPGYLKPKPESPHSEEKAFYEDILKHQAAPYILRRSKTIVAPELPDKIEQVIYCKMDEAQSRFYQEWEIKTERTIFDMEARGASESQIRFAALQQLLRLRQICVDPHLVDPHWEGTTPAKLKVFQEILDEARDGGHRMLVFSQFVSALKRIADNLDCKGIPYCYLDGKTRKRLDECDKFNSDTQIPVFLISLKAGGLGLNLTGANWVVHLDPWWNPASEAQATDRAHRIGQKEIVTSIKLIVAETVEEKVMALQQEKSELLKDLLDMSDITHSKIGLDQIKSILKKQ